MTRRFDHAVVAGGGGMLAGMVRALAARADRLTLISRNPGALAAETGARAVALDWSRPESHAEPLAAIAAQNPDLLLSWLHDDALPMVAALESLLRPGALSLRVHGALSGDPAARARRNPGRRADLDRRTLVLGWVEDETGPRWLADDEISAAAIRALDDPRPVQLAGPHAGAAPGDVRAAP